MRAVTVLSPFGSSAKSTSARAAAPGRLPHAALATEQFPGRRPASPASSATVLPCRPHMSRRPTRLHESAAFLPHRRVGTMLNDWKTATRRVATASSDSSDMPRQRVAQRSIPNRAGTSISAPRGNRTHRSRQSPAVSIRPEQRAHGRRSADARQSNPRERNNIIDRRSHSHAGIPACATTQGSRLGRSHPWPVPVRRT